MTHEIFWCVWEHPDVNFYIIPKEFFGFPKVDSSPLRVRREVLYGDASSDSTFILHIKN